MLWGFDKSRHLEQYHHVGYVSGIERAAEAGFAIPIPQRSGAGEVLARMPIGPLTWAVHGVIRFY